MNPINPYLDDEETDELNYPMAADAPAPVPQNPAPVAPPAGSLGALRKRDEIMMPEGRSTAVQSNADFQHQQQEALHASALEARQHAADQHTLAQKRLQDELTNNEANTVSLRAQTLSPGEMALQNAQREKDLVGSGALKNASAVFDTLGRTVGNKAPDSSALRQSMDESEKAIGSNQHARQQLYAGLNDRIAGQEDRKMKLNEALTNRETQARSEDAGFAQTEFNRQVQERKLELEDQGVKAKTAQWQANYEMTKRKQNEEERNNLANNGLAREKNEQGKFTLKDATVDGHPTQIKLNGKTGDWEDTGLGAVPKGAGSGVAHSDKMDKGFVDFNTKLTENVASGRSTFGKAAETVRRANALQPLIEQTHLQPTGGDRRQVQEIASGLDSMIRGGQTSESTIKGLMPDTYAGKWAAFKEKILNEPEGTEGQEFLKRIQDTIFREKGAAVETLQKTKNELRAGYSHLEKADKARYDSILKAHGIDDGIPASTPAGSTNAPAAMVTVSDGTKTYQIRPDKAAEAEAHGFKVVK